MNRNVAFATAAILALLLSEAVTSNAQARKFNPENLDLLRFLSQKPWIESESLRDSRGRDDKLQDTMLDTETLLSNYVAKEPRHYFDDDSRLDSQKRSAVASALNSGRRRRQPAPALGKEVTPYIGVGVLNDIGSFMDSLRNNLEILASLSPEERSTLYHEPPTVIQASSAGSGGGVGGYGRIHTLRPIRPTALRYYNRRSSTKPEDAYPGANNHDPRLLWTGVGR